MCTEMMNASIGYISTIDEDDEFNRRPKFAGLGTVIYGQYLITAYHVLRRRIEHIYDVIKYDLCTSSNEDEIRQMILEKYEDIHAMDYNQLVDEFVNRRRKEELNKVDPILEQICNFVNIASLSRRSCWRTTICNNNNSSKGSMLIQGDLNSRLSSKMNIEKCFVEFSCGKFLVDWKILHGDEENDVAIVKLKTTRQQPYPDSLYLEHQDSSPRHLTMKVVRESATNRNPIDLEFQPLTPDELEEKRQEIQWQDSPIFDLHLVIFRTDEWFETGTSGSSMIHMNQNQAVIHAIFQRMHPQKYFEEHGYEMLERDWEQLLGSGRKTHHLREILISPAVPTQRASPPPLCTACRNGNTNLVEIMLEDGANVNVCDGNGCTPLEIAVAGNHFDVVVMLIGKNADVNKCGTAVSASTPLCTACRDGRLDIVRLLLDAGADISIPDGNGRSPLQLARDGNHEEIMRVLEPDPLI